MIVAMDRNRAIGFQSGQIPWKLPRDRDYFRAYTHGKWLAIGRRTYEEMEGWFSDHRPVVITHKESYDLFQRSHLIATSIDEAITTASSAGASELVVCGGAQIYESALKFADSLFVTRVDTDSDGDICFPVFENDSAWHLESADSHPSDKLNAFPMTFEIWKKKR